MRRSNALSGEYQPSWVGQNRGSEEKTQMITQTLSTFTT